MSISSEQAIKMVNDKMSSESENSTAEAPATEVAEPSTAGPEDKPKETEEPETEDKPKETETETEDKPKETEEPEAQPKETQQENKKLPPSKRYTKAQRIAHSFAIEKRKRQDAQARVKELEQELDKIKGLKPSDFGDDVEAYTSYRLDEQKKLDEIERRKEFIEQSEKEELARETELRVSMCFPDEDDRADYEELIASRGPEFYEALQQYDKKGVVLDYLNGVEEYPKVLRELMTNTKSLSYVFRDKDPEELRHNLHVFTKAFLAGNPAVPEVDTTEKSEQQPVRKPAIPVIGKQVTAQAKPTEPVHDRAYWNEYLRKHPNG